MAQSANIRDQFLDAADNIIQWSRAVLDTAPLTETQTEDMLSVNDAAHKFRDLAATRVHETLSNGSPQDIQHLRHRLRNHLNIIVGFTQIWLRQLPDNLLLQMATIRQIHQTGSLLLSRINAEFQ